MIPARVASLITAGIRRFLLVQFGESDPSCHRGAAFSRHLAADVLKTFRTEASAASTEDMCRTSAVEQQQQKQQNRIFSLGTRSRIFGHFAPHALVIFVQRLWERIPSEFLGVQMRSARPGNE